VATNDYGLPFSQIAVLTTHRHRDALLDSQPEGCPLVRWEQRRDAVLCETVQRTKGIERTAIVLVDMSGDPDRTLLYVGVSRAVASLTLVGPPGLAHAAGVAPGVRATGRTGVGAAARRCEVLPRGRSRG
jgi:hypothetical protein